MMDPPGPEASTTSFGETIFLHLTRDKNTLDKEETSIETARKELAGKNIQCRLCKGDHFTSKCPFKDTLGSLEGGIIIIIVA